MSAQVQIINKVLQTKDYSIIEKNNLSEDFFFTYKAEFNYIKNHFKQYQVVPDQFTFLNVFPDWDIIEVNEPDSYLLEAIQKEYTMAAIATGFNKAKGAVESNNVDKAIEALKKTTDGLSVKAAMTCTSLKSDLSRYDRYLDRISNHDNYYISTGFKELDDIIGGIDIENENMVIAARTGIGKCLARGTKVLMADGTLKVVEDVVVGDKIQSYNRVNTVLGLHNGTSNGWKIIPNKGEAFVVSADHILTLFKYNESYNKEKGFKTTDGTGTLVDITVEDFLKLSKHQQHLYKLFRPAIEYDTKQQDIPPYILGLWLGDGTSKYGQICTADAEIAEALEQYAKAASMELHLLKSTKPSKAKLYSLTGTLPLQTLLRCNNLINNKHIPLNYLTGDRQQRLELLAGLLDTDGSYITKNNTSMFDFTAKNKVLFDQTAQLCRGLGYKVSIPKAKQLNGVSYFRMNISGKLSDIPTRVKRKQAKQTKNVSTNIGFRIEPVDVVNYYGFMCDGDHRYLLADNTLTHNTWTLLAMAAAAAKAGKTVGIYSGEMTADKVFYRIDTLLGNINNTVITRGTDASAQHQYKQYLDNIDVYCPGDVKVITPNDINGPATVDAIQAFIEKEHIQLMFIDQYSLLEDTSHSKVMHERVANISKAVKNLQVMKRIPIVSVSQLNREKNDDGEQDTTQIGLSDRIGQDATTIIMLNRKLTYEDEEKTKVKDDKLILNVVKSRDGGTGKLEYHADFNNGKFIYLNPNATVDASRYETPRDANFQDAEYGGDQPF